MRPVVQQQSEGQETDWIQVLMVDRWEEGTENLLLYPLLGSQVGAETYWASDAAAVLGVQKDGSERLEAVHEEVVEEGCD